MSAKLLSIRIVTEAPLWLSLLCIGAGLICAALLYFRDKRLVDASRGLLLSMSVLRFFTVSILAFLLLGPLLKTIFREVEKPVIILAQDNSESLILGKDSTYFKTEYPKQIQQLIAQLSENYQVRQYTFGDQVRDSITCSFSDKQTDMSSVFEAISNNYYDRNLGAIIFASDGIYNQGQNPVFTSEKIKVPVFTVALGDTTIRRDLVLNKVVHNRLAYLGNTFPLEAVVDARRCLGAKTILTVRQGNVNLFSKEIDINSEAFTTTIPIQLEAKAPGLQRYTVSVRAVENEITTVNNTTDVFIEVLDAREKILILGAAPHPDMAALKQTIELNDNYQVESDVLEKFKGPIAKYNLVILHGLPNATNSVAQERVLTELKNAKTSVFYITGNQSSYAAFNALKTGITIQAGNTRANDCEASPEKDFPLFILDEKTVNAAARWPALQTPFGSFQTSPAVTTLFRQKIGTLKTEYPLWAFSQQNDQKIAVLIGEGIWRWRLHDFAEHGNQQAFTELISKTVQYLAVRQDKSFFRITAENTYPENRPVLLEAEVYNDSYEAINEPEVNITFTSADGKKYPFTFSKTTSAYRLDAGRLPVGEYRYAAQVKVGSKVHAQNGVFTVSPVVIEALNTTADHQLLFSLAQKHQGEMVQARELDQLVAKLKAREDIKPVIYNPKRLVDLIQLPWVFFLILILLSAEWFMRKRNGAY